MDREGEVAAHVALIEAGMQIMSPDVTNFTIVADTHGLGFKHNDPGLMRQLRAPSFFSPPFTPALMLSFFLQKQTQDCGSRDQQLSRSHGRELCWSSECPGPLAVSRVEANASHQSRGKGQAHAHAQGRALAIAHSRMRGDESRGHFFPVLKFFPLPPPFFAFQGANS